MNNPDKNTTPSGITELKPRENTSQETEIPQKADTQLDTKGPEPETTDLESAGTSEMSWPTEYQRDTENCVYVQWAEDVLTNLSDYERFRLGPDEEQPLICFLTEQTIEDFKELDRLTMAEMLSLQWKKPITMEH